MKEPKNTYITDLFILSLVIGFFYALFLGRYALIAPDEARYAEIAREMVATKDWLSPHLNYLLYIEKPILFYWLEAFAIKCFGLSEWVIRFWPACFAVLSCLATYITGRKLFDRNTGFYAAFILATSLLFFAVGHINDLDMAVSFFMMISLYAFFIGQNSEAGFKKRLLFYTMAIAAACALLTKGLIGLVFPLMIIGLWVLFCNQWREIKKWYLPTTILVFLIVALPWHILIQLKHSSFFHFYFVEQQLSRYVTDSAGRYEPFYFYSLIWLLGLFPWSVFLFQSIKFSWQHRNDTVIYLLIWIFSILLFFSFSQSQLIPYIVPIFPPSALLIARYLSKKQNENHLGINLGFILLPLIALALGITLIFMPHFYPVASIQKAQKFLYLGAGFIIISFFVIGVMGFTCSMKYRFIAIVMTMMIILTGLLPGISHIDHRSIKPLAQVIQKQMKPNDLVVSYDHYYQDLPFYLQQKVIVVDWFYNELAFGIKHDPHSNEWMWTKKQFWKIWKENKQRIFVITRREDNYPQMLKQYPLEKFYLLAKTQRNVLLSNRC